ncbi:LOW QUALITY PROTEIN: Isopenicillin N synthase-like, Fe(2+) 2OG dioxygenase domain [Dillenia turbinata]|uniref:Isopenicillin N synthase-like, Fe(2+) 2OG dioxygenase domain n=1 Tax=Dillenia turbinata TaxID=194707 RepID=A0AAN8ZD72_9MAGN
MDLKGEEGLGWGGSLPVPSVQEMVRKDPQSVPKRYIQSDKTRPLTLKVSSISEDIPVINFSRLVKGDEDERRKLDFACTNFGFFQVTDHGIEEEVLQNIKSAVAGFYRLPLVEKMKHAMKANDLQGYGQAYVASDEQKLDWCDLIGLIVQPAEKRNMKYWPTTVLGFKEAVEAYSAEMQRVTEEIFANLSVLMHMDHDGLKTLHGGMWQAMRMNYYPTCSRPDLVLGVSPHSDAGSITLLLQDDEIPGLQIKHYGGWVPVKPIPNAIVVNIADVTEVWSNGKYKSIEHRAVTNQEKPRMSIATFFLPNDQIKIGPLDSMVDDSNPKMYRRIKYLDYIRHTFERKMDGKANIEFLKCVTCHDIRDFIHTISRNENCRNMKLVYVSVKYAIFENVTKLDSISMVADLLKTTKKKDWDGEDPCHSTKSTRDECKILFKRSYREKIRSPLFLSHTHSLSLPSPFGLTLFSSPKSSPRSRLTLFSTPGSHGGTSFTGYDLDITLEKNFHTQTMRLGFVAYPKNLSMEKGHSSEIHRSQDMELPVPSVQDMVRNNPLSVPERYVQEDEERPSTFKPTSLSSEIPVISLSSLANGDENERRKLDFACTNWGFFRVMDHGIKEELRHNVKTAVAKFYDLPFEEKKKYAVDANDVQGYGQAYVVSDKQKLDWCDQMILKTRPPEYRDMKFWPTSIPGFQEAVEQYSAEIHTVSQEIIAHLSLLMRMDRDSLKRQHGELMQAMRLNYYPTCSRPDLVLGVGPHSDSDIITLLLQDDEICGLQIRHKGGWVPVKPIPNSIVVNIGDVMEVHVNKYLDPPIFYTWKNSGNAHAYVFNFDIWASQVWSNGKYKSIEHRATTNPEKARISIATFVMPDFQVEIGPLDSMADASNPRRYKNIKYLDYLRKSVARKMEGKAHTEFLKIEDA